MWTCWDGGVRHVGILFCSCSCDNVLSAAWTCRDDKGLNGLLLSQNDLHLILRGFTHGGRGEALTIIFSCRFNKELSQKRTLLKKTEIRPASGQGATSCHSLPAPSLRNRKLLETKVPAPQVKRPARPALPVIRQGSPSGSDIVPFPPCTLP